VGLCKGWGGGGREGAFMGGRRGNPLKEVDVDLGLNERGEPQKVTRSQRRKSHKERLELTGSWISIPGALTNTRGKKWSIEGGKRKEKTKRGAYS